jgi:hypothetical protein
MAANQSLPPAVDFPTELTTAVMADAARDADHVGQFLANLSKERRDLAQRMIYTQLNLAKAGFSTGGPKGRRRLVYDNITTERVRGQMIVPHGTPGFDAVE